MSQGDINMPPPSELGMNKNKYMHHVYINIDMGKIMIKSAISQQKKTCNTVHKDISITESYQI